MKQAKPISIIVPTLNEADNLELLFKRIDTSLKNAHIAYEIIIIDDHSSDATYAVAKAADTKYNVRIEQKRGKRGKAFSLLEGFELAQYDVICMIDADLQYPPESIPSMFHKMEFSGADVVITNRVDNGTGLLRKIATTAFHTVFTRLLFGISYDTQSGLKLFKKHVLNDMSLNPSPWTFDLEFIIRSLENKYVIVSQDIEFAERYAGTAKINLLSAAFEGAWQSLKLWRTTRTKRVKKQYKMLQPLQRRVNGFAGFAAITFGLVLLLSFAKPQPSVSALELTVPSLQRTVAVLTDNPDNSQTNLLSPVTSLLNNLQNVTTPATNTQPASVSTAAPAPSSTTTSRTAELAVSNTKGSGSGTLASVSSTGSSSPSSNNTIQPTTATGSISGQDGKNDAYYPQTRLSANKTSKFEDLALYALEIGAVFVLLGILVIVSKKLRQKLNRQHPIWN